MIKLARFEPSVPVPVNSQPVPAEFPKEGQYRFEGPSGAFLRHASCGPDEFIPHQYWDIMSPEQQQYVRNSLASRGLTLCDRSDGKAVVTEEEARLPIPFGCMNRNRFDFMAEDIRIWRSDCIVLSVTNVSTKAEALRVLNQFLKQVHALGIEIV